MFLFCRLLLLDPVCAVNASISLFSVDQSALEIPPLLSPVRPIAGLGLVGGLGLIMMG